MVDTQRFAIWHPPGTDVKKPAPVPIIPEQPQALNKNIENLVKDFKWNDGLNAAKPSSVPTSRQRIQSVSSYTRPTVAPQPIHLAPHLGKTDEDDSGLSSSEEDVVKILPTARKFSSSSPVRPILNSTPVSSNLSNTRPKAADRVSFSLPKVGSFVFRSLQVFLNGRIQGTPKENENSLSQTRTKATEKPTSHGPKVVPLSRANVRRGG